MNNTGIVILLVILLIVILSVSSYFAYSAYYPIDEEQPTDTEHPMDTEQPTDTEEPIETDSIDKTPTPDIPAKSEPAPVSPPPAKLEPPPVSPPQPVKSYSSIGGNCPCEPGLMCDTNNTCYKPVTLNCLDPVTITKMQNYYNTQGEFKGQYTIQPVKSAQRDSSTCDLIYKYTAVNNPNNTGYDWRTFKYDMSGNVTGMGGYKSGTLVARSEPIPQLPVIVQQPATNKDLFVSKVTCGLLNPKSVQGPKMTGYFKVHNSTGQQMQVSWLNYSGVPRHWDTIEPNKILYHGPNSTELTHWFKVKLNTMDGEQCAVFKPENNVTINVKKLYTGSVTNTKSGPGGNCPCASGSWCNTGDNKCYETCVAKGTCTNGNNVPRNGYMCDYSGCGISGSSLNCKDPNMLRKAKDFYHTKGEFAGKALMQDPSWIIQRDSANCDIKYTWFNLADNSTGLDWRTFTYAPGPNGMDVIKMGGHKSGTLA